MFLNMFLEGRTHRSGPVDSESEAAADDVEAEADEAVKHALKQENMGQCGFRKHEVIHNLQ